MTSTLSVIVIVAAFVVVIIQLLITRISSGENITKRTNSRESRLLPYWIPYFGHVGSVVLWPDSWLQKLR
jgi:hypothetical protein